MHRAYARLFEPVVVDGRPNPRHLARDAYLALGKAAAEKVAQANRADAVALGVAISTQCPPTRITASRSSLPQRPAADTP
jgi:hypothetical protein